MNKQFLIIVGVVIAVLVGLFVVTQDKDGQTSQETSSQPSNHTVGAGNKNVTLVEYGDFQCPACGAYYPLIKQIKNTYGDDITFQFRNFPLNQIHPNAFAAHRAAEAAGKQGKFFEMHDLLYENQQAWTSLPDPTPAFDGFASQLGLNIDQYHSDFASEAVNDTINTDIKHGQQAGANSTPTFILNGEKIENPPRPNDLEGFKELIDEAIEQSAQ